MTIKRMLANMVEQAIGARIVRPWNIGFLFEEQHLRRFLHHFEVDCVFDVGANLGQYAMMLRERAGYAGPIVSFEPNPHIAAKLRENASGDNNWFVEQTALGASAERGKFNVMTRDQMSSFHQPQTIETDLFRTEAIIAETIEIKVSTLEIELAKYRLKFGFRRPFLKMDTQGHDVEIAKGAGDKLRDFVGLQSELAIKQIYAGAPNYIEALKFYSDSGFVLSAFVPNNAGHFPYLIETDCIMFRE